MPSQWTGAFGALQVLPQWDLAWPGMELCLSALFLAQLVVLIVVEAPLGESDSSLCKVPETKA